MPVNTTARLAQLRKLMTEANLDAYIVPSADEHGSEYPAPCDLRREFITGFSGSAGTAIITLAEALLWTDGRYWVQAASELDDNWKLMKQGEKGVETWSSWVTNWKPDGVEKKIGVDARLLSSDEAGNLSLEHVSTNLVDSVWGSGRPARPKNEVFHLGEEWSGEGHLDKIQRVRDGLKGKSLAVTALDEVAWLFNLRGSDIAFNPVFFAFAIIHPTEALLFVQEGVTVQLRDVTVKSYTHFYSYLSSCEDIIIPSSASLAISPSSTTPSSPSPIAIMKSRKNDTELEGFRASHIRDGVALARYFSWLAAHPDPIDEHNAALKLEAYRAALPHFKGLSFPTISSSGPNAAIVHYDPPAEGSRLLNKETEAYLCDSGGQYMDGTTDVTRTWWFSSSPASAEMKDAFTRVLQGHIAIDTAVFPEGTTGYLIDCLARRPLWAAGLDYKHGTGHGIGHFLCVHEGPHGIGTRIAYNSTPLEKGMTVSNEPGYYKAGEFGIRIESVVLVQPAMKGFLKFERVTLCPIGRDLIDVALLSPAEVAWVDEYHAQVLKVIGDEVRWGLGQDNEDGTKRTLAWLDKECAPLARVSA